MDPQIQMMAVQLGENAVRNTASSIADKVRGLTARKQDHETIAELEALVNDLVSDKSELVRIAKAYEEELVAQRISKEDIEYISNNLLPILKQLAGSAAQQNGQDEKAALGVFDVVQPLLSVETVTVLQLVGFNFRKAIGDPLTDLVAGLITSRAGARNRPPAASEGSRSGTRHR